MALPCHTKSTSVGVICRKFASALLSVVPVLPAESRLARRAAVPVPPVITPFSMSISHDAVSAEIARTAGTSRWALNTSLPVESTILLMKIGGCIIPPFAIVDATVAISVAVDSIVPSVRVRIGCSVVWVIPIL